MRLSAHSPKACIKDTMTLGSPHTAAADPARSTVRLNRQMPQDCAVPGTRRMTGPETPWPQEGFPGLPRLTASRALRLPPAVSKPAHRGGKVTVKRKQTRDSLPAHRRRGKRTPREAALRTPPRSDSAMKVRR
jgi:hypothetical protein